MKQDQTERLVDYLEGRLAGEARDRLETELRNSPVLREELEGLRQVLARLEAETDILPSPDLSQRFHRFLEAETLKQETESAGNRKKALRWPGMEWRVAAAVAFLLIGAGFGTLWQRNIQQQQQIGILVDEVRQTRRMMILAMLEQNSPSERIKALNVVRRQQSHSDPQIVEALIQRLLTDDNVNVRAKAADALRSFPDQPAVIDALIQSLQSEEHPEVQLALIDVLVAIRARQAVQAFQSIIEQEEKLDIVKGKAAEGIEVLM